MHDLTTWVPGCSTSSSKQNNWKLDGESPSKHVLQYVQRRVNSPKRKIQRQWVYGAESAHQTTKVQIEMNNNNNRFYCTCIRGDSLTYAVTFCAGLLNSFRLFLFTNCVRRCRVFRVDSLLLKLVQEIRWLFLWSVSTGCGEPMAISYKKTSTSA